MHGGLFCNNWLVLIWCSIYRLLPRITACSQCRFLLPRLRRQYSSVYMPQGTCVCVRPGRRQKMTPDLYLSAFKSRVLWLNTTTEQFACCKALRLNRWFSAPCQVILPWQRWLQCYQLFFFFFFFYNFNLLKGIIFRLFFQWPLLVLCACLLKLHC